MGLLCLPRLIPPITWYCGKYPISTTRQQIFSVLSSFPCRWSLKHCAAPELTDLSLLDDPCLPMHLLPCHSDRHWCIRSRTSPNSVSATVSFGSRRSPPQEP